MPSGVYIRSEETKKKISNTLKGRKPSENNRYNYQYNTSQIIFDVIKQ